MQMGVFFVTMYIMLSMTGSNFPSALYSLPECTILCYPSYMNWVSFFYFSEETISALLDNILHEDKNESVVISGLSVIQIILEQRKPCQMWVQVTLSKTVTQFALANYYCLGKSYSIWYNIFFVLQNVFFEQQIGTVH